MSEEGQNEGSMYWRARADEWKAKAEANAQAAHALEAMRDRRLRVSPPGLHDQWSARTENDSVNVGFGADPIEAVAAYERAKGGE